MFKQNVKIDDGIEREIRTQQNLEDTPELQGPFKCVEQDETGQFIERDYLVTEKMEGDLFSLTSYFNYFKYTYKSLFQSFITVLNTLHVLHEKGFGHFDIKPDNIVINMENGRLISRLIDFGWVLPLGTELPVGQLYGTTPYTNPYDHYKTMVTKEPIVMSKSQDIWSVGISLLLILTKNPDVIFLEKWHDDIDGYIEFLDNIINELDFSREGGEMTQHLQNLLKTMLSSCIKKVRIDDIDPNQRNSGGNKFKYGYKLLPEPEIKDIYIPTLIKLIETIVTEMPMSRGEMTLDISKKIGKGLITSARIMGKVGYGTGKAAYHVGKTGYNIGNSIYGWGQSARNWWYGNNN